MRTIKFRGKCVPDSKYAGEWVTSGLSQMSEDVTPHDEDLIVRFLGGNCARSYHVIPETVGQFTGLFDKNGTEIYEGDIVECVSWNEYFTNPETGEVMQPFRRKMCVDFRNGAFKMVEKMPEPMKDNVWDIIYNGDIEIIGNIHDNPELLKETTN